MNTSARRVIGIDFDNTLAIYDDLFANLATAEQLLAAGSARSKRIVRDAVRALPDGDEHWQRLQAQAYGPRVQEAQLAEGAREFLHACHARRIPVFIISHKTEFSAYDTTGTNLRTAALAWLSQQLFADSACGLSVGQVRFAATRQEKLEQIVACGCHTFIDDLEEVFAEPEFPPECAKILFHAEVTSAPVGVSLAGDWNRIREHLFGE